MKFFTLVIMSGSSLALCTSAFADSSCGLDEALIGTKAIGSIWPNSLVNTKYSYDPPLCELKAFEAPADSGPADVMACSLFKALREDNLQSDYYRLKVYDADGTWLQISGKDGEKKWVQQKTASPAEYPYHHVSNDAPAFISRFIPTQTGIYDAPNLKTPARHQGQQMGRLTDAWIDAAIPLDFFGHEVFKTLKTYGVFNPNHIEDGTLATHYGDFLYAAYNVKAIIKDDQGREWLKAEEYLDVSIYDFGHVIEKQIAAQGKSLFQTDRELIDAALYGESFRSQAGQTVYFPYREPSGTLTMVMTHGPECD